MNVDLSYEQYLVTSSLAERPMSWLRGYATPQPGGGGVMLADTYVDPGSARTLLDAMGGLTGLGLLVAVVGGLIGWGASGR